MDRISDDWKKYPLAVIGSLPALPPGAVSLSPGNIGAPGTPSINNFYIIVANPPEHQAATLIELAAAGVMEEQVILYLCPNLSSPGRRFGTMEALEAETAEEFRARLLNKLQSQRQHQLPAALRAAHEQGLDQLLSEPALSRTLDITRIAHALCCGYALPPGAHARVLHDCLAGGFEAASAWTGQVSPELLIPGAAEGLYRALVSGTSVRETLRDRLAPLSYRVRNELLHHCENCVGAVTGGRHAA